MSNPITLLGRAGTYLLLSLAAFLSIFPFFWMVVGASNTSADIIRGKGTPGGALWDNIVKFVNSFDMVRVLFNSFLLAGLGTVLTLLIASMAGYGFEMFRSRFREKVFGGLLLMLSIPFAALMIPLFICPASPRSSSSSTSGKPPRRSRASCATRPKSTG
jgi:lactose/L-arabinose transport system permease protein